MPALTIFANPPRRAKSRRRRAEVGDVILEGPGASLEWIVVGTRRGMTRGLRHLHLVNVQGTHRTAILDTHVIVVRRGAVGKPVRLLSAEAIALSYAHIQKDGAAYEHKFARGVFIELLQDGSVRLFRPDGKRLYQSFNSDK